MNQPRVAFVTGHAHWGKSKTLQALTGGRQRSAMFNGVLFRVRRMSNDDRPEEFLTLINGLSGNNTPNLLAAYCPTFSDPDAHAKEILNIMRRMNYRMYFFVLVHQFEGQGQVTSAEQALLRRYGTVELFTQQRAEAPRRAASLHTFLTNVVAA